MNRFELAHLAWPILVNAADERRVLTYGEMAERLKLRGARPVRFALWPIQDLCLEKGWPPLTSIVVSKSTGKPGPGFIAWPGDLDQAHEKVFRFDWRTCPRPFPPAHRKQFAPAARTRPKALEPDHFAVRDQEVLVNGRGPYQDQFRRMLLRAYRGRCALCDTRLSSLLVASHIVPWALDPKNRLNPRNGILLCRVHDGLFEAGLLRITPELSVSIDRQAKRDKLGKDLFDFLHRTRSAARRPPRGLAPAAEFLRWRLNKSVTTR